jgi:hypothetical protein
LGGCAKFFKPEYNSEFREGDRINRIDLLRVVACVLSWRLCKSGEGILSWVYVGANDINFNSRIKDKWVLVIEIEKELKG